MKYICSIIFNLLLISATSINLLGQDVVLVTNEEFRPVAQEAMDSLYNRNPDAARQIMQPWIDKYPEHPVWSLWHAMELWWEVLTDLDDTSHDEEFFERMKKADFEAGRYLKKNERNPDGLIVRAAANGYIARQKSNREEWLSSLNHGRMAYQAQQAMTKVLPDFADNLLAEGIIKYYAAYLPDAYPFMKTMTWFLPEGDREKGLDLIRRAVEESLFAGPEALYFAGVIELNYEQDYDKAATDFRRLATDFPNNGFYRRLLVRSLFNMDRYDEAAAEIESAISHWHKKNLNNKEVMLEELFYWKGRMKFQENNYSEAYNLFEKSFETGDSLPNTDHRTYKQLSGYFAGVAARKLNNNNKATDFFKAVTNMNADSELSKKAKEMLSEINRL